MKTPLTRIGCILALLAVAAIAPAGTVDLRYRNVSPGRTGKVRFSASPFNNKNVYIGQSNIQIKNPDGADAEAIFLAEGSTQDPLGEVLSLGSWCVDVNQSAKTNWRTYEVLDLDEAPLGGSNPGGGMGLQKARAVKNFIFQRLLNDPSADPQGNNHHAAAFGAGLWEIINENWQSPADLSLSSGGFRVDTGESWRGLANGWLTSLSDYDVDLDVKVFTNTGAQDFAIYVEDLTPPNVVPEPLTMLTAGLGALAVGRYARRRFAK
jgi:hypothetical protein